MPAATEGFAGKCSDLSEIQGPLLMAIMCWKPCSWCRGSLSSFLILQVTSEMPHRHGNVPRNPWSWAVQLLLVCHWFPTCQVVIDHPLNKSKLELACSFLGSIVTPLLLHLLPWLKSLLLKLCCSQMISTGIISAYQIYCNSLTN